MSGSELFYPVNSLVPFPSSARALSDDFRFLESPVNIAERCMAPTRTG
jgi:hypothetical protein